MMLRICLFFLAVGLSSFLAAQNSVTPDANKGYAIAGGVTLSTRGTGLCAKATMPMGKRNLAFIGEVTGLHSPYERKIQSPRNGRNYVLGKMYTAQIVSLGVALERPLIPLRGGNLGEISAGAFLTVDAVVYRPYYLEILRSSTEVFVEPYDPNDLGQTYDNSIYGKARTPADAVYKTIPGIGAGTYLFLDLAHEHYQLSGAMLSLRADFLTKPLQLMATQPQSSIFVAASCALLMGSKW
jgi:hypothetical protein